jgi:arginyl-tRNA--protein-N-Asp/Glu arginylyltransferase
MPRKLVLPQNHWIDLESGPPRECPYLPEREILLDLGIAIPDDEYFDALMERGHRRLGQVFYRPGCLGCRDCVPIRVPLSTFSASKSQRRCWRRHADRFRVEVLPPLFRDEHFELYQRHSLHVSDDNEPGDGESYSRAFLFSQVQTHLLEYRVDGELVGCSVLDEGARSVSSVYVFWDPDQPELSLGTFSALWEMRWAERLGKEHYYLGYWVQRCSRMNYKNRFRPYELYDWHDRRWRRFDALTPALPSTMVRSGGGQQEESSGCSTLVTGDLPRGQAKGQS